MSKIRHALYWQIGGLAIAVALFAVLSRFLPVADLVEAVQQRVAGWGVWGAICYPLLFAACNVLLLPGGVLAVGGGFFFGLWWGFLIVFIGNVLAAAISFAFTRRATGQWLGRKLSQNPTLRILRPAVERESWKIILLSQLHPLFPTSLLNYVYGLTQIRFGTYMLWSSMGRIPGLFLYVYVGTLGQLGLRLMRGRSQPRVVEYWTWGGAFITTVLFLVVLGRIAYRAIQTSQASGEANDLERHNREIGHHSLNHK
jgi:uncharacterized membrane protein YdjX (TVP38/TMEM64 family)